MQREGKAVRERGGEGERTRERENGREGGREGGKEQTKPQFKEGTKWSETQRNRKNINIQFSLQVLWFLFFCKWLSLLLDHQSAGQQTKIRLSFPSTHHMRCLSWLLYPPFSRPDLLRSDVSATPSHCHETMFNGSYMYTNIRWAIFRSNLAKKLWPKMVRYKTFGHLLNSTKKKRIKKIKKNRGMCKLWARGGSIRSLPVGPFLHCFHYWWYCYYRKWPSTKTCIIQLSPTGQFSFKTELLPKEGGLPCICFDMADSSYM